MTYSGSWSGNFQYYESAERDFVSNISVFGPDGITYGQKVLDSDKDLCPVSFPEAAKAYDTPPGQFACIGGIKLMLMNTFDYEGFTVAMFRGCGRHAAVVKPIGTKPGVVVVSVCDCPWGPVLNVTQRICKAISGMQT